jgi:hypothetical protein
VLLSGDLDLLDFDDEDARTAGHLRATLEQAGTPIGAHDLLIAGQAGPTAGSVPASGRRCVSSAARGGNIPAHPAVPYGG